MTDHNKGNSRGVYDIKYIVSYVFLLKIIHTLYNKYSVGFS